MEFLRCKNLKSQTNELLMKLICHNICCLVNEIFENEINIDFKKYIEAYVNRKRNSDENSSNALTTKILPS